MSIRKLRARAYARWNRSLIEVLSAKFRGAKGHKIAHAFWAPNPFFQRLLEKK